MIIDILGIDPGPEESAVVRCLGQDGQIASRRAAVPNDVLLRELENTTTLVAIESMDPYGGRLGNETIRTLIAIGEFSHAARMRGIGVVLITRREVKRHLCGVTNVGDPEVRDALIERYGPGKQRAIGTKGQEGPLYGISKHLWAALGVALCAADRLAVETGRKE